MSSDLSPASLFYKVAFTKPLGHLSILRSLTQSHLAVLFTMWKCTSMASGARMWSIGVGYSGFHMVRWEDERWEGQNEKLMSALFSSPFSNTKWLPFIRKYLNPDVLHGMGGKGQK